jgi:hypothetical protein
MTTEMYIIIFAFDNNNILESKMMVQYVFPDCEADSFIGKQMGEKDPSEV